MIFGNQLKHSLFLNNKNKCCFYLTDDYLITEIFIHTKLQELDKYYLGSEITNPENAIIFDKTKTVYQYLKKITKEKEKQFSQKQQDKVVFLITEFQNRFEACSNNHAKSDGYKFSVLFSHGLNAVVRLIYLCYGGTEHDYMPPNFLTDYSYRYNLEIEKLGTMNLQHANWHKRKLLDLFITYLPIATEKFNIQINENGIIDFLENIYKRDFFWNFRDISKFNPKLRKSIIFRSSALSLVKEEGKLVEMLKKHNINAIIDLRAENEIVENSYSKILMSKFDIVRAPLDPRSQSVEFQNTYNKDTNDEIAYHSYVKECKSSIKKVIEKILNSEGAVVIHCHAGKDRTGVIISMLHLLSGADYSTIFNDYMASKMDTKKEYLNIVLNTIKQKKGIKNYLLSCGINETQLLQLKQKILNNGLAKH